MMKCPYCGCECDSSAVGDHAFDCRGYGENAETGPWFDECPSDEILNQVPVR